MGGAYPRGGLLPVPVFFFKTSSEPRSSIRDLEHGSNVHENETYVNEPKTSLNESSFLRPRGPAKVSRDG